MSTAGAVVPGPTTPVGERRHAPRRVPDAGEPLAAVRVRGGRALAVVDVSDRGVLVDGHTRLLPGTHVDVHVVTTAGRVLVRTRIVRAVVRALRPDGIQYRSALAFEQPLETARAQAGDWLQRLDHDAADRSESVRHE